jgi:DNA-binding PadR family transcriptional regulator
MFGFHRHHQPDRAAWAGHCGGRSRHQFGDRDFEEHGMFGHRGGRHGEGLMRGGARTRLFAQGDLRLVVLALLQERPRHGYEVIKAIEERVGGDYSPSPGVIYPTLTLLAELGHAQISAEQGERKQYAITPEGEAFLADNKPALDAVMARLDHAARPGHAMRAPEVQRALQNFRMALHLRLGKGTLSAAQIRAIAEAIDQAAVAIERS